jgi:2-phospho-L-lactate guanylyltransferase
VSYTIVMPLKGGPEPKSRFGGDPEFRRALARAMALDTVEAALAVAPVIAVTTPEIALDVEGLGATVIADPGQGLNAAIESGLVGVSTGSTAAVLLGDLPGLDPRELREALEAAAAHELSFVADADGEGTVLVVAQPGIQHRVAFGPDSRRAHLANGYVELLDPWVTLRRDIDRAEHLHGLTLGPRTRKLLG